MGIAYGAKSDIGLKRTQNEDRLGIEPSIGLYMVCDGMGGHTAGEVASGLAVEVIQKYLMERRQDTRATVMRDYDASFLSQTNRLAGAIRVANHVVHCEAQQRIEYARMGTTVVSALISGQVLSFAHVGDSRLYLIRDRTIRLLTRDHSLVMEQIRDGLLTEEEAERSAQRHIVTRALGSEATVDVELGELPMLNGDVLLLCSDGLTRGVPSRDIVRAVQDHPDLQTAAEVLIALANAAGGEDNTTVILVGYHTHRRPPLWHRIRELIGRRETPVWT